MYPYDLQSTPICREAMPSSVYAAAPSLSRLDVPTCYSSTSLNIPSSLHLHPSTWCWINIPNNTCSGPGSPCSKLQPSVDFRKEVQTPQLGITKLLWSAPNTSTTPLECQVMASACFLQGSDLPTSHLCSNPSLHWKRLLSAFKYTWENAIPLWEK